MTKLQVKTYDLNRVLLDTVSDEGFEYPAIYDLKQCVCDGVNANYDRNSREWSHYMNQLDGYNANPTYIVLRSFDTDETFEFSFIPA